MTATLLPPALAGFSTGLGLILAIGAQNAFVLRQGLLRRHVFWICLTCAASDAALIAMGVAGFGALVEAVPWFPAVMRWLGAAFLGTYGALRLRDALRGTSGLGAGQEAGSLSRAIATTLAFTWANPHVYLDTLVLIGGLSTRHDGGAKLAFALGAMAASFVFFFALGYGARALAPVLRSQRAWVAIDLCLAALMFGLAGALLLGAL